MLSGRLCAVLEAPTLVAGLDDIAVVRKAIEHGGCHFGVAEHPMPIGESQIGGNQQRGVFIKFADQVEQQLSPGLTEWQLAEFVDDDEVVAQQLFGESSYQIGQMFSFLVVLSGGSRCH